MSSLLCVSMSSPSLAQIDRGHLYVIQADQRTPLFLNATASVIPTTLKHNFHLIVNRVSGDEIDEDREWMIPLNCL